MKTLSLLALSCFLFFGCLKQDTTPLHKLVLTHKGVNTLGSSTPFEKSLIAPKLFGYEIALYTTHVAQKTQTIMRVTYENKEVMLLFPSKAAKDKEQYIQSIVITSDYVANPFGLKQGALLENSLFSRCQEKEQTRVCSQEMHPNIYALYAKTDTGAFALKEIVWTTDRALLQ